MSDIATLIQQHHRTLNQQQQVIDTQTELIAAWKGRAEWAEEQLWRLLTLVEQRAK